MSAVYTSPPMLETTRPSRKLDRYQPVRAQPARPRRKVRRGWLFLLLSLAAYFLAPLRTNVLVLGTDIAPARGALGRTDTLILTTVVPFQPYIGLLSIPRDLWVQVPGVGEQRINTAYFYAESAQAGTGGAAAAQAVRENFGVPVRYYVLVHMGGLVSVIDALGGVDVQLDAPLGGLPAGTHHLDGAAALAFARDRSLGDDFGRMQGGQLLLSALLKRTLQPSAWHALPRVAVALAQSVETNLPLWQMPRLLFALLRAPLFGVDSRTITREMVTPYTTSQGAQVLLPNWDAIRPVLREVFGH